MALKLDMVNKVAQEINKPEDEVIRWVNEIDPTNNKKYNLWILKEILRGKLIFPEDNIRFHQTLEEYIAKMPSKVLRSNDLEDYEDIYDLEKELMRKAVVGSKKQGFCEFDPLNIDGVELIAESGAYRSYGMTTKEAIGELGEGTKWCTRKSYGLSQAESYIKTNGFLILVLKNGQKYAQLTPNFDAIMDVNDHSISARDMEEDFKKVIHWQLIQEKYSQFFTDEMVDV